jgi:hypothetical protein
MNKLEELLRLNICKECTFFREKPRNVFGEDACGSTYTRYKEDLRSIVVDFAQPPRQDMYLVQLKYITHCTKWEA